MATPRVFVSHSHHDNAFCREVVSGLRSQAMGVWYDEQNLGWGALRATIEREMPLCQHFVAILSPAAVVSEWVNTEIDAALELFTDKTLHTMAFVVAERCAVPLLLRRWKRIEGPDAAPVSAAEAVAEILKIISPPVPPAPPTPALSSSPPAKPSKRTRWVEDPRTALPVVPWLGRPLFGRELRGRITLPEERLPAKLVDLGFAAYEYRAVPYILPPTCMIAAGPFTMGSDPARDPHALRNEQPAQEVYLQTYHLGRYPVTVAEYACFVRTGYREPGDFLSGDWDRSLQHPDHPAAWITWADAMAYAEWLAEQSGMSWRLPTEAEWEKAARWDLARGVSHTYPWGDTFDKARCNTAESDIETTTPIDAYSQSAANGVSPSGVVDMGGNVWEWTRSLYRPYPYHPELDRNQEPDNTDASETDDEDELENHVLRGGSWIYHETQVRAAYRYLYRATPSGWEVLDDIGFRLAWSW